MSLSALVAFSFSRWWNDSLAELTRYFNTMDVTQWMIISACAVTFGFLCLRGTGAR